VYNSNGIYNDNIGVAWLS